MFDQFVAGQPPQAEPQTSTPSPEQLLVGLLARQVADQAEREWEARKTRRLEEPPEPQPMPPGFWLGQQPQIMQQLRPTGGGWRVIAIVAGLVAAAAFIGIANGLTVTPETAAGATPIAGTAQMAVAATPTMRIVIPTQLPRPTAGGSYNNPKGIETTDAAIAATATTAPTDAPCVLITWANGSQSCDDGRAIDEAHSQPGYCVPVVWEDESVSCNDGKPSGKVVWPEGANPPQPTPWPAAPSQNVAWSKSDGPSNNTCVTLGQTTACSDPGVKLDADDAAFVARMIEDGKIKPGQGTPKG